MGSHIYCPDLFLDRIMITLYKHQKQFVNEISYQFRKGKKHVLGQSPTGSGKTVMFSYIAKKTSEKGNKVLIVTDRTELLFQAGGTIENFQMNPFYIKAGTKFIDNRKSIFIAMAQTLRNRVKTAKWKNFILNGIDLIIIDECHIQEFNYLFDDGLLDKKHVIGFTATPVRSGKMTQLGLHYETIVSGKPIKWLIKKGYLVNCDIYDCGSPDMSKVAINKGKGDYSEKSMFRTYDSAKLYKGLVKNYQRLTPGQKMIVFCCNVEHAIKTTKKLTKAGIRAKFICSEKTPPKEPKRWTSATKAVFDEKFKAYKLYLKYFHKLSGDRKEIIDGYKAGDFEVLVNVDMMTKGFDDPSIQVVALYRATMSLALYLQMLGRGGRTSKNKTHFTVFDFGGNKERFGGYDYDRDWNLWHEESKPGAGVPPMKVCGEDSNGNPIKGAGEIKKGCTRLVLAAYRICPFCGFKYPVRDKAKEIDLALAEIIDEHGESIKKGSFKDMDFDDLFKYRKAKKHHLNWVWNILWNRGGEDEIIAYGQHHNYSKAAINRAIKHCSEKWK